MLQSMGSQRVGPDLVTEQQWYTYTYIYIYILIVSGIGADLLTAGRFWPFCSKFRL